ncbi:hypothetical protein MAXJ12_30762 [Mesorhizobium alhagi CCNWXJ12-2]|uniref:Uncharacterized protein n=1 Tax=Mesorhizobium alhagi CCNWXJ12-2 TaxID=1107882 RepID=H0I115_9HYPH|nr:hypothetical protein MAXJ12_30762 [Mesorhizobium alhagi CCNWXJ12-2]
MAFDQAVEAHVDAIEKRHNSSGVVSLARAVKPPISVNRMDAAG